MKKLNNTEKRYLHYFDKTSISKTELMDKYVALLSKYEDLLERLGDK
jgi:hypothetical protein